MKRIFNKNVSKLVLTNNTYSKGKGPMIEVKYTNNIFETNITLTGICFDKEDNLILKFNDRNIKDSYYTIDNSDTNKVVAKLILNYLMNKKTITANFNPYNKANNGVMLFLNYENPHDNITGIGLDINNNYIIQKVNNDTPKYNNRIFYTPLSMNN